MLRSCFAAPYRALGRIALGFACLATVGCSSSIPLRLGPDVKRPPGSAVIFFVDGMDLTRLERMVAQGRLPNIRHRFVDGGTQVNAVTSLPSITHPNCATMITGLYPGHHGIMGNFWFDRETLTGRYYATFRTYWTANDHFTAPTLYDILKDRFTVSIQAQTHRGVTETIDNAAVFAYSWFIGDYLNVDSNVGMQFQQVGRLANERKQWPTAVMTYYPATDEMGHQFGSESPEYGSSLENIDAVVGQVTAAIESAGLGSSTYYVLTTDHSHTPIGRGRYFDVDTWIRRARHMRVCDHVIDQPDAAARLKQLSAYDAIAGLDEDRSAMIHLRGGRGWDCRPGPQEIEAWIHAEPSLLSVPAVEFALVKADADRVHVLAHDGSAFVERHTAGGHKEYRLVAERGDPLRYFEAPELARFAEAGWHDSRSWLAATIDAEFPDFVAQVVDMFDSPHTGDVVVFAADDWSLCGRENGGHGSCHRRDMRIPLFMAGPGIPRDAVCGPGRLVDVVPTIVALVGERHRLDRFQLDGINLTDMILHGARRNGTATSPGR